MFRQKVKSLLKGLFSGVRTYNEMGGGEGQGPPRKRRGVKFAPSGTQKCLKMGKKYVFALFALTWKPKMSSPGKNPADTLGLVFQTFLPHFILTPCLCATVIYFTYGHIFSPNRGVISHFFRGGKLPPPFQTLTWTPPPPKNFTSEMAHYKLNIGILF